MKSTNKKLSNGKSSRLVAFETLHKILYDNAYSNIALDNVLAQLDGDKAFVSALVYGVVERKLTLDYFINQYVTSKPKPKIMTILRLGAYQLLFMDKVPDSAAINESVALTKEIKQDYYSKLVNAVLRKIAENKALPDDLSIRYSVPQPLINMWKKQYGEDKVKAFLPCLNDRPPVFAIPNKLYVDSEELFYELQLEGVDCDFTDDVVILNSSIDLHSSKAFQNGLFYIEDLSSYNCARALRAKSGETVFDMCSAPGGKAFTIAGAMKNEGELYCFDLHSHRVKLINDGADRLGFDIIKAQVNDACVFNEELPKADRVICDVPCSGFGIIRRKPEIRYKELDSVKELPELQLQILKTSSKYVKLGGTLLYSTCTLNKKENEKVVKAFLENNKDFTLVEEKTTFPTPDGGDGFYYALLKYEN